MILKIIFSRIGKSNLTYSIKQIIILRKNRTKLVVLLIFLFSAIGAEVQDVVIFTNGNAVIGRVISITNDSLFYLESHTKVQHSVTLKSVYYAYNHFGKILFNSRSLLERMTYIEHYSGLLGTVQGDTVHFNTISFDRRMTNPMVFLTTSDSTQPIKIPFLEVEFVRMSAERFDASVKRGCYSSCGLILVLSGLRTMKYFKDDYTGEGLFSGSSLKTIATSASKSITDILPAASFLGVAETGNSFHFATMIIPMSTMAWMANDWFFDRRTVYINPIKTNQPFPKDMFLFSLKEWSNTNFRRAWIPLSRSILNQIYKIRQAIWKG